MKSVKTQRAQRIGYRVLHDMCPLRKTCRLQNKYHRESFHMRMRSSKQDLPIAKIHISISLHTCCSLR